MYNTHGELFERFVLLGRKFQQLGSIVQNSGQTTTHDELDQFEHNLERLLVEMKKLSLHTVAFYQRSNLIEEDK